MKGSRIHRLVLGFGDTCVLPFWCRYVLDCARCERVVVAIEIGKDRRWRRRRELIFDEAMASGGCLCVYNGGDFTQQLEGERTSYCSKAG